MKILKKYPEFLLERAPSIPKSEEVWKKRGKKGKEVMLYFHDDMDGVFSAIVMQGWLKKQGFKIVGYGIVNYQEGWNTTTLNPEYINIALDYAENVPGIDVYIDHHGQFAGDDVLGDGATIAKDDAAAKTQTGSAYEGICDQLGVPTDALVLSTIDMIDSAKYDDYNIDIKTILQFDPKVFKNKLQFAGAFNQLLKRSDYKTFIEVVANHPDAQPSIYKIFDLFKKLFPANNLDTNKLKAAAKAMDIKIGATKSDKVDMTNDEFVKYLQAEGRDDIIAGAEKPFLGDAAWRLGQMRTRTQGRSMSKEYVKDQADFKRKFQEENKSDGGMHIKLPGYQILGQMMFVPAGSWANGLRARAILEEDLDKNSKYIPTIAYEITDGSPDYEKYQGLNGQERELIGDIETEGGQSFLTVKQDVTESKEYEGITGIIKVVGDKVIFEAKQPLFWILLQYGNTLQVCSFHKFDNYDPAYLPELKDGTTVDNLGAYCENLLANFVEVLKYNKTVIKEQPTVAGGHKGIGTISNIFGSCHKPGPYQGVRFLDIIKNKMISDLSMIPWPDLKMPWGDKDEVKTAPKPHDMDKRTLMRTDIRTLDPNERSEA